MKERILIGSFLILCSTPTWGGQQDLLGTWLQWDRDSTTIRIELTFEAPRREGVEGSFILGDLLLSSASRGLWSATDSTITTSAHQTQVLIGGGEYAAVLQEETVGYVIENSRLRIQWDLGEEVIYQRKRETAIRPASWSRVKARFR